MPPVKQSLGFLRTEVRTWTADKSGVACNKFDYFYAEDSSDPNPTKITESEFFTHLEGDTRPRPGVYTVRCTSKVGIILFESSGIRYPYI